jgi:HSP90 family molecular chaperone
VNCSICMPCAHINTHTSTLSAHTTTTTLQVEFKAVLYVPSVLPYELSRNMFDDTSRAMRLYVKRVFINDKFEELLPRWLMFLRGLVDSEDLPLNVGREILQRSKMLSVINKRLVRKAVDMFQTIAEDEEVSCINFNFSVLELL